MSHDEVNKGTMLGHQRKALEAEMVGEERWAEIRRQHNEEGQSISAIARQMDLDRKTVRRCIRDDTWRGYQRRAKVDTLLAPQARARGQVCTLHALGQCRAAPPASTLFGFYNS